MHAEGVRDGQCESAHWEMRMHAEGVRVHAGGESAPFSGVWLFNTLSRHLAWEPTPGNVAPK